MSKCFFTLTLTYNTFTSKVDDVPEEIKQRRLREIIAVQRREILHRHLVEEQRVGRLHLVLVEGLAKKKHPPGGGGGSPDGDASGPAASTGGVTMLTGRSDTNKRVVFPSKDLPFIVDKLQLSSLLQMSEANQKSSVERNNNNLASCINTFGLNPTSDSNMIDGNNLVGKYVIVKVSEVSGVTLRATPLAVSSISAYGPPHFRVM